MNPETVYVSIFEKLLTIVVHKFFEKLFRDSYKLIIFTYLIKTKNYVKLYYEYRVTLINFIWNRISIMHIARC